MENGIQIRSAQGAEDARSIARLAREIWTEHYTPIIGAAQVEYMLAHFQSAEKIAGDMADGYTYDMAEIGGKLVGYCGSCPEDGGMFLSKLYVAKEARGRGVARLFLQRLTQRCGENGRKRIRLTVNKNNAGSIAAYRKMGFDFTQSIVTDIGGGYVMDDYVFTMAV